MNTNERDSQNHRSMLDVVAPGQRELSGPRIHAGQNLTQNGDLISAPNVGQDDGFFANSIDTLPARYLYISAGQIIYAQPKVEPGYTQAAT